MATTTNYGWSTPDDTALVKDGAAAIRTLGSSVDTTTKALNPSTTLGDIEYRSATANTNTRLAIGSTGNVLTVTGGVPTWAAPAGGALTWSLLNTGGTALTGATSVTVSGISAKQIMVFISGASTTAAFNEIALRPNNDSTAANYAFFGLKFFTPSTYGTNIIGPEGGDFGAYNLFPLGQLGSSANGFVLSTFFIDSADSNGWKRIQTSGGGNASTDAVNYTYNGLFKSTGPITSITIRSNGGNLDGGTVFIYGGN